MDMNESGMFGMFVVGMIVGALIMLFIIATVDNSLYISQETATEICQSLTNKTNVNAYTDENYKLVCEMPSYDDTQNIIIQTNSETK